MLKIDQFQSGTLVEAKDFNNNWLQAKVLQVDQVNKRIKVHYIDQDSRFDDWLTVNDDNVKLCSEQQEQETCDTVNNTTTNN